MADTPKYYVSDDLKQRIGSITDKQGFGSLNDQIISSLESTGKVSPDIISQITRQLGYRGLPDQTSSSLSSLEQGIKPYYEGLTADITNLKSQEGNLTSTQLKKYLDLIKQADKGHPDQENIVQQNKERFKQELLSLHKRTGTILSESEASDLADRAAQRFVVERKTGEMGLATFIANEVNKKEREKGIPERELTTEAQISDQVKPLSDRLGEFISKETAGSYKPEIERVGGLLAQAQKSETQAQKQTQTEVLSQQQLAQAQSLFQQAQQTAQQPGASPFSPELSSAVLRELQSQIQEQGKTALADTEAAAQARGITGSSTEQFGLAQTEKGIQDTLAQTTLNFLLQSGQAGMQNRQFIVNTLQQQANALLGAGQQTGVLAENRDISQQGLDLSRSQLQAQIQQFNQQLSQQQSQFQQQMQFAQQQAQQDMQLLLRQLGGGRNFGGIGTLVGGLAGAGLGALIPGAGVAGAGLGASLGSLFGQQVGLGVGR